MYLQYRCKRAVICRGCANTLFDIQGYLTRSGCRLSPFSHAHWRLENHQTGQGGSTGLCFWCKHHISIVQETFLNTWSFDIRPTVRSREKMGCKSWLRKPRSAVAARGCSQGWTEYPFKIPWPNLRLVVILQTRVIIRVFLRKIWLWHVMTGVTTYNILRCSRTNHETYQGPSSTSPFWFPEKASMTACLSVTSHIPVCVNSRHSNGNLDQASQTQFAHVRSLTHRSSGLKYRILEERLWEEQEEFWRETLTFKVSLIIGDHLEASNSFVARRRWRNDCHLGGGPRGVIAGGSSGWKHDLSLRVPVPVLLLRLWIVVVYLLNIN